MKMQSEDRDPKLTAALRALAEEAAAAGASPAVEARLLEEVRSIRSIHRRRTYATVFALAAAVVLAVAVSLWRFGTTEPLPDSTLADASVAAREVVTPFFSMIYGSAPPTGGHIVRMEVPRRALSSFGLAVGDSVEGSAPGTVLADVIVGEDGLARAVRFVHRSIHQEQKR